MTRQQLIDFIQGNIYPNGRNQITAPMVRDSVLAVVSFMGDAAELNIGSVVQNDPNVVTGGAVYNAINSALSSAIKFQGITTTPLTDGSTQQNILIDGQVYTAKRGDEVIYGGKEFLWTGSKWQQLGDEESWALKTISITGSGYLTGGGNLEQNRTIDISATVKGYIDHGESAYNALGNYATITALNAVANRVTALELRTNWDTYFGVDQDGNIYVKPNGNTPRNFSNAGGVASGGLAGGGGGGGGLGIDEMWQSLKNEAYPGHYNDVIATAHIPDLEISKITGLTTALAGKADASALNDYLPLSAGSGKALTGALYTAGIYLQSGQDLNFLSYNDDSGDIVFFYSNGKEKMRIWTDNYYSTNRYGPNCRVFSNDGTLLNSGRLLTTWEFDTTITNYLPLSAGSGKALTGDLYMGGHAITGAISVSATTIYENGTALSNKYLALSGGTMSNTNVVTNLNADLLDGRNGSAFTYCGELASTTAEDLHSGIYTTQGNNAEMPYTRFGDSVIHCFYDVNAQNQLYLCYDRDEFYFRRKTGGTWQSWKRIAFLDSNVASATYATSAGNSDTLDNRHASGFAYSETLPPASSVGDIQSGIYSTNGNQPDLPVNGLGNSVLHCNWDVNAATELFFQYSANAVYFRRRAGGTWQAWVQLYHSGNANSTSVAWSASSLTLAGSISGCRGITFQYSGSARISERGNIHATSNTDNDKWGLYRYDGTRAITMLNASGYIGVYTDSPNERLEVNGNVRINEYIHFSNIGTGAYQLGEIACNSDNFAIQAPNTTNSYSGTHIPIKIGWRGAVYPLTLAANTYVGINNPNPQYTLDVAGAIGAKATGTALYLKTDAASSAVDIKFFGPQTTRGWFLRTNIGANNHAYDFDFTLLSDGTEYKRMTLSRDGELWVSNTMYAVNGIASPGYVASGGNVASSDARLKSMVETVTYDKAKEIINSLYPKEWVWNEKHYASGKRGAGLIAQQVEDVLPFAIIEKGGYKYLNYDVLNAYEIALLQGHETRIDRLERENRELRREIETLRTHINS